MAKHVCEEAGDTEGNWHFQGRTMTVIYKNPQRVIPLPSISCSTSSWSLSHYTASTHMYLQQNQHLLFICMWRNCLLITLRVSVCWHCSGELSLTLLTAALKSELLKGSCMYFCIYQLFLCLVVFLVSLKKQKTAMFDKSLFILKDQHLISFSMACSHMDK